MTVAASPHYWAQLDVAATVHSLLQYCPRFWHSDELHQTLRNGQLVLLDGSFFAQELLDLLQAGTGSKSASKGSSHGSRGDASRDRRDGGSSDRHGSSRDRDRRAAERLLADLDGWLASTPHLLVCRRLMHLLPEPALVSAFRQTVMKQAGAGSDSRSHAAAEATARQLVFSTQWRSLDDLLLAHAMTFRAVDLWRWMQEDSTSLQVLQHLQDHGVENSDPRSPHHYHTVETNLCQTRRMIANPVNAMQAAERALRALQDSSALPGLWAVQRHAAALPAAASARLLLAEKLSAHLFLHEHIKSDAASLERLLQLCSIPSRRLPSQPQHQLLPEPESHKHKKKKHKKGSKKRRRSTSVEHAAPAAGAARADVVWEVSLVADAHQKQSCSAQQLHAVIALQMLSTWHES